MAAKKTESKREIIKKEEKIEVKKPELGKEKEVELKLIFGIMIGLIVLLLGIYFIMSELNKVEYKGLAFAKERFGEIPVYRYSYFFNDNQGQLIKYNLFLRNDPRTNTVPIEGEIALGGNIYISINSTGLNDCKESSIAVASLAAFIINNQLTLVAGTPDLEESKANNVSHITCEIYQNNPVILIQAGEETKIVRENNCYRINVANCDINPAIEKFEVQTIIDAKKRQ